MTCNCSCLTYLYFWVPCTVLRMGIDVEGILFFFGLFIFVKSKHWADSSRTFRNSFLNLPETNMWLQWQGFESFHSCVYTVKFSVSHSKRTTKKTTQPCESHESHACQPLKSVCVCELGALTRCTLGSPHELCVGPVWTQSCRWLPIPKATSVRVTYRCGGRGRDREWRTH